MPNLIYLFVALFVALFGKRSMLLILQKQQPPSSSQHIHIRARAGIPNPRLQSIGNLCQ